MQRLLSVLALSLMLSCPALAQAPAAPRQAIKLVKPGLYMVTGDGGNVTVRVTSHGLIVVDSKNRGDAIFDALMAQIRTVTSQPIKVAFLTHSHGDHAGNSRKFLDQGAQVIGEQGMPGLIARYVAPANASDPSPPAPPNVTYVGAKTVILGGATAMGLHYAPAHTSADTIVYFPDLKVVAGGDEIIAGSPNFDYPMGANLAGWIRSIDETLKLDWDLCIPGHGDKPMTRAEVVRLREKFALFLSRGKTAVAAGATKETLLSQIKIDDLMWTLRDPFPQGQLDGLWAEMSAK